jgi:hypothetical protein
LIKDGDRKKRLYKEAALVDLYLTVDYKGRDMKLEDYINILEEYKKELKIKSKDINFIYDIVDEDPMDYAEYIITKIHT